MIVDLRCKTERFSLYSGCYDDASINLLRKLLERFDGHFLDVGGNIGMYSVRIATSLDPRRRSLCFEPMPSNADRILDNARLNDVADRVDIHRIALSDTNGQAELVLRDDFVMGSKTGNASIAISSETDLAFRRITVAMKRFDDLLNGLPEGACRVAKVDIEGHEDYFLRGASGWLRRDRPVILLEVNNWFYERRGTTSSAAFASSIPNDYRVAILRPRGDHCDLEPCAVEALDRMQGVANCLIYPPEFEAQVMGAAN